MTDNANTPARRIDDHLPSQPLHWEDQPEAVRQEHARASARLANAMADAGAAYLAHMGTGGGIAAIPHTGPAQYVVAGTMAAISKVLGKELGAGIANDAGGGFDKLHANVMNLHSDEAKATANYRDTVLAYKTGHRDARHAAAELVNEFAAQTEQMQPASQSQAAQPTIDHDEFWSHVIAYCRGAGKEGQALVDYVNSWHRAHIAGTSQAPQQPAKQTDLAQRLRAIAAAVKPNDPALVTPKCLTDSADEIDRYYTGMMAWKQTAEKKDRDWNAERMGRVNDRIAERASQATKAQAKPLGYISAPACEMLKSNRAVSIVVTPEPNTERVAIYAAPVAKEAPAVPEIVRRAIDVLEMLEGKPTGNDARVRKLHSAIEAYEASVASVAKEATRDAETTEKANVLPPFAAPAGQREALYMAAINCGHKITDGTVTLYSNPELEGNALSQLADRLAAVVTSGFREGRNTKPESTESSDVATTTSTVSAPNVQHIPANFTTHRAAWREAITACINYEEAHGTADQAAYWKRERAAYDRAFDRLLDNPEPVKSEGAQKAPEEVRNQALAESEQIECWSHDEEDFNARSLGELLGTHDDLKPGDTVWVGEAVHPDPANLVNEHGIIENIGEAAYDIGGEHAEDYPEVTNEQAKELESLVADWIKRTCPPTFYTVENIKPYVLSHEDFPHDRTPIQVDAPDALRTSSTDQANADTGSAE